MKLSFSIASVNDIVPVVALMNEAAAYLTTRFGKGHWSYEVSEKTVSTGISASSKILVAKDDNMIIGTLRLTKRNPGRLMQPGLQKWIIPFILLIWLFIPLRNAWALEDIC
ncbi:MAG: hypothetical protein WDO16_20690 [Bacteroidota bacterium]